MSDDFKLDAQIRTDFGKGAARKLRAVGKIPAVIYGHGGDTVHVSLPAHETGLIVRRSNAVITLNVDGDKSLVLVKDIQRDPVRQIIEHIDLVTVVRGEKVEVEVPIVIEGDPFSGSIVVSNLSTVRLEVEATHIPERVVLDIAGATEGTQFSTSDLPLPQGAALVDEADLTVAQIVLPQAGDDEDAAGEAAAE